MSKKPKLTATAGAPVADNQNSLTIAIISISKLPDMNNSRTVHEQFQEQSLTMVRRTGNTTFTYEWLGMPPESGVPPILDRSMTSATSLKEAIDHAKSVLMSQIIFPTGQPYGVRIFNSDSILVWAGNIDDAAV